MAKRNLQPVVTTEENLDVAAQSHESEPEIVATAAPIMAQPENESLASVAAPIVFNNDVVVEKSALVDLISNYRSAQSLSAVYSISDGEIIIAKIDGAEVARAKLQNKDGNANQILEANKQLLRSRLAAFASFTDVDILSQSKHGSVVCVISNDGRKYRVDLEAQTVNT